MDINDSASSQASCEYAGENANTHVKQLDINVLMAALLKEKCVSLEQDDDKGHKLFADVYGYLLKSGVLNPLSSEDEKLIPKQKEILDTIMKERAQNAPNQGLSDTNENMRTTGQNAAQCLHYSIHFEPLRPLGEGSFGKVTKVKHKLDGKIYAMKKIKKPKNLREVEALARLKHPNIIGYQASWLEDDSHVYGSEETSSEESEESPESESNSAENNCPKNKKCLPVKRGKQLLCIQMEFWSSNLEDWLKKRNNRLINTEFKLKLENLYADILKIFDQILNGVDFIHNNGWMHRDLKPDNMLLNVSNLHLKICDFGLAKRVNGSDSDNLSLTDEDLSNDLNTNTSKIGNKLYGAPELLNGQKCNEKCDIYSLGIIYADMCNIDNDKRHERIKQLRQKNRCHGEFLFLWTPGMIQFINELINPVAKERPTAEKVLKNDMLKIDGKKDIIFGTVLSQIKLRRTSQAKAGTVSCGVPRCRTCPYVVQTDNLTFSNDTLYIHDSFSCVSHNVIYAIICKRCGMKYIGKTGKCLRDRFRQHLTDVENKVLKPVPNHFNGPNHSGLLDMSVTAIKYCFSNDIVRNKSQESRLIYHLGCLSPGGLNTQHSFI